MTTQALGAYKSHDLSIMMKTSSGDVINLDFSSSSTMEYAFAKNKEGTAEQMKLASMSSFSFSMQTNGLSEQDKQEIEAFMEIARPYIDNFLDELKTQSPRSTVNKVAREVADIFSDMKGKDEPVREYTKGSIVKLFDDALEQNRSTTEAFDRLFEESKKLLERTLHYFDSLKQPLYA